MKNAHFTAEHQAELFAAAGSVQMEHEQMLATIREAIKSGGITWQCHKQNRAAFIGARITLGCSKDASAKAWERFCKRVNYTAPLSQSASAVAQRAARAGQIKTDKPEAGAVGKAAGAKIVGAVKMELSSIEAHLVDLFRRGKFKDVVDIVHSEAEKAAPM